MVKLLDMLIFVAYHPPALIYNRASVSLRQYRWFANSRVLQQGVSGHQLGAAISTEIIIILILQLLYLFLKSLTKVGNYFNFAC